MPIPVLALHGMALVAVDADHLLNFLLRVFRIGLRQIHLVQHRDDFHAEVQRGVAVGDRLRFNTLAGINDEQCTFARRERTADFI